LAADIHGGPPNAFLDETKLPVGFDCGMVERVDVQLDALEDWIGVWRPRPADVTASIFGSTRADFG
jgi:hypothetical protein